MSFVEPHLEPITAPLSAEKNPFRDQGHQSWRAKIARFAHDHGEVVNVGKTRSRHRNELPPRWPAHHCERCHCSGSFMSFRSQRPIRSRNALAISDQSLHLTAMLVPQAVGTSRATLPRVGKPGGDAAQRRNGGGSTSGSFEREVVNQVLVLLHVCGFHQSREIRNKY